MSANFNPLFESERSKCDGLRRSEKETGGGRLVSARSWDFAVTAEWPYPGREETDGRSPYTRAPVHPAARGTGCQAGGGGPAPIAESSQRVPL